MAGLGGLSKLGSNCHHALMIMLCDLFTGCSNLPWARKEFPVKIDADLDHEEFPAPLDLTPEDLRNYTNQFSQHNLIGHSQFGKFYRGTRSDRDVVVKIVVRDQRYALTVLNMPWNSEEATLLRFQGELKFLQAPRIRRNPNLPKLIGSCRTDEILAFVYDLTPRDTLCNLILRDDFKWLQSVKTALSLARLLNYLHDTNPPYLIRNFNPAHIVADQNFTPVLLEFGMLVGEALGFPIDDSEIETIGPVGYMDPTVVRCGPGYWNVKSDVYNFGVLLLNLITKRIVNKESVLPVFNVMDLKDYKTGCSLVHLSLKNDRNFNHRDGCKLTELAMECIDDKQDNRPKMKEVVKRLKALRVVQQLGEGEESGECSFYGY